MKGGWPSREVAALADWIRERTGLTFPPGRREPAAASLSIALGDDPDVDRTIALLGRDSRALDELLAELTIGESYFFRHPEQFEIIRSLVLPGLRERGHRPVRVWSAGCATGEEAYSLAAMLHEQAVPAGRIVGTDISRARLSVARRGRYRRWSLRGVPQDVVQRHFLPAGSLYELSAELRARVEFRYLNLVADAYPSATAGIWGMDLILCRNVLIYLDRPSIERVARKLVESLSDDGWLLLGASDPAIADIAPVDVVVTDAGLVYRRAKGAGTLAVPVHGDLRSSGTVARQEALPPTSEAPAEAPPEPVLQPTTWPTLEAESGDRDSSTLTEDQIELLYWEQRYDDVVTEAERLLAGQPSSLRARLLLVRALANRGDLRAAGEETVRGLEIEPTSAELLYLQSILLLGSKRARESAIAAKRALYLDPGFVMAHMAFADACMQLGHTADARRALRNAERILTPLPTDEILPASDGETAGRMLRIVQFRQNRLKEEVAPSG